MGEGGAVMVVPELEAMFNRMREDATSRIVAAIVEAQAINGVVRVIHDGDTVSAEVIEPADFYKPAT